MKIGANVATKTLLGFLSAVIFMHLLIMLKVIPYNIAWGGRLQNDQQMYAFEAVSIAINALLVLVLLMKGRYIPVHFKEKGLNIVLWAFFVLFILNTVGNLFAQTAFEKLFAILTLIFAYLIRIILRSPSNRKVTGLTA
jgi:hypothetical protein